MSADQKPEKCPTCGCEEFVYIEDFGWVCKAAATDPEKKKK